LLHPRFAALSLAQGLATDGRHYVHDYVYDYDYDYECSNRFYGSECCECRRGK
jgi:hypothetical protein